MSFLIILSPFITVACLLAFTRASISLFAGCAAALVLFGFVLWRGGEFKMPPPGCGVLFSAPGGYQGLIEHEWSDFSIRLAIDVGMLAIALVSIAMKMPFTLQYAREQVDAETM